MLDRLASAIHAELTVIESIERRADEVRETANANTNQAWRPWGGLGSPIG
jgi:hypothetical protein